jgi:error-prone DNA polymerase
LSRTISVAQLAGGQKGRPVYDLEQVAADLGGEVMVLTGCRKGHVRAALDADGVAAAGRELDRLVALFGRDSVVVELTDHAYPVDDERNDALAELARRFGLPAVATGNVHYHRPGRHRLAQALAAVRARRSLDEMDGWLPLAGVAHLRSGEEMAFRFTAYPGAVARAAVLGAELAFDLQADIACKSRKGLSMQLPTAEHKSQPRSLRTGRHYRHSHTSMVPVACVRYASPSAG